MGNSVTIGLDVHQSALFTELIEKSFADYFHSNPKIDIINAGQPGYNINHFLPYSRYFVYPYQPDIILYQFTWNDVNVPSRIRYQRFPDQVPQKGPIRFLLRRSNIFSNLLKLRSVFTFVDRQLGYYKNPEIINGFYQDLFEWAEDARNHDIEFLMAIFPWAIEIQSPEKYPGIADEFNLRKNEIVAKCESAGIKVFDLSKVMREDYLTHKKNLFKDQGHLNVRGHKIAAQFLEEQLQSYIAIPTSTTDQ